MFRDRDGYRVQWRENGRRRSKTFATAKEAKLFELQLEVGVADKTPGARSCPTFRDYADEWMRDYCRVEKRETQWAKDELNIRLHLSPAFGGVRLVNLKKSHLLALKTEMAGKRAHGKKHLLAKKSINNVLALAKKILETAVDRELIQANPFARVPPYKLPKQDFKFWGPDERDRFIAEAYHLDPPFVTLVAVASHTGLRLGELAALTRADLDFDRRMIRVRGNFNMAIGKLLPTKGGEIEDVPMNPVVMEALWDRRQTMPSAEVFPKALFVEARKRLRALAQEVGVQPIRFHDLRHGFASCAVMSGMSMDTVQQLLRHKSGQMTKRYVHLHPDHLKGATDALCRHASGTQPEENPKKWWAQRDLNPQPIGYEPTAA